MSYNPTRQTLYALISSLESDLRRLVGIHLGPNLHLEQVFDDEALAKAFERLESEEGSVPSTPEVDDILVYTDFPDLFEALNRHRQYLPEDTAGFLREHTNDLEYLVAVRNRVAHSRPLEVEDFPRTLEFCEDVKDTNVIESPNIGETLERLKKDSSFVLGVDLPSESPSDEIPNNLPLPEYDETGFIGREEVVRSVKKACLGPYPVVTVLGEGGVGKTAVALKVAYDIVDQEDDLYDTVVWSTSKTTKLTGGEISRIEGAIQDSLGLFKDVKTELAGELDEDPIDEILTYLEEFNILLILDNLETVLDDTIKSFLERLPRGSKILITSRVGVGAFENPIRVKPLGESDALRLLRAVAQVRQVPELVKTGNDTLRTYCERMKYNPAWIKWFVSAVQSGRRPEEVLADPSVFLEYCMSNVYERLSDKARKILDVMAAISTKHTQPEIAHLSNVSALELQPALQELLSANIIRMHTEHAEHSPETSYELTELARAYINEKHPVAEERYKNIMRRRRQLSGAKEEMRAQRKEDPYSPYTVRQENEASVIVAHQLYEALRATRSGDYDDAQGLIQEAERLAPEYSEVFRVKAWYLAQKGNASAANRAYKTALELAPESPQIRRFYGGFLLKYLDDVEGAHEQFKRAAELDPEAPEVLVELARTQLYRRDFEKAKDTLGDILDRPDITTRTRRIALDLSLQYYYRQADYLLNQEQDPHASAAMLEKLKKRFKSIPRHQRDVRMKKQLDKALPVADRCAELLEKKFGAQDAADRIRRLSIWFEEYSETKKEASPSAPGTELEGVISRLPVQENYGYVRGDDEYEYFFHKTSLVEEGVWNVLREGTRVEFVVGASERGPTAEGVSLHDDGSRADIVEELVGEKSNGVVISKQDTYAFVRSYEGPRFFFHQSDCEEPDVWADIDVGDQVVFLVGEPTERGPTAQQVTVEDPI